MKMFRLIALLFICVATMKLAQEPVHADDPCMDACLNTYNYCVANADAQYNICYFNVDWNFNTCLSIAEANHSDCDTACSGIGGCLAYCEGVYWNQWSGCYQYYSEALGICESNRSDAEGTCNAQYGQCTSQCP